MSWKITENRISRYLGTGLGITLSSPATSGALIFNTADYCPFADKCLSFNPHSRGNSGYKGVQNHLKKVHPRIIQFLMPCTHADLVKYESLYPESVNNIFDGIKSGRLKFCPSAETKERQLELEERLRTLYAEKRQKDHCKILLNKTIPRSSRNVNRNDINTLLSGLEGVWTRGLPSEIGASGKGDAMRARMHAISTLMTVSEGERSFATVLSEVPAIRIPARQ